ncbi:MAG TPA: hypothetical protein VFQ61_20925 [Polyangiaceae bacterium]|nr:hypothetical protein [Polyangiaceae bacterium]
MPRQNSWYIGGDPLEMLDPFGRSPGARSRNGALSLSRAVSGCGRYSSSQAKKAVTCGRKFKIIEQDMVALGELDEKVPFLAGLPSSVIRNRLHAHPGRIRRDAEGGGQSVLSHGLYDGARTAVTDCLLPARQRTAIGRR